MDDNWYVYILRCSDKNASLYTGITNNLVKRLANHNNGKGAKFTRCRLPVSLVYSEVADSKSSALKREINIKKLKRNKKLELINVK